MTEDEYLALEDAADEKHEFINGEIIAMAGGTLRHAALILNVGAELKRALSRRPCLVLSGDARVNVDATGMYTYPDLSIVCGLVERAPKSRTTLANPMVLVEVLSPSTEAYDRGAKFAHYRHLPSLQAYVLVAQDAPRIEVYQRVADGGWLLKEAETGEILIPCLEVALDVDAVYRGLELLGDEEGLAE